MTSMRARVRQPADVLVRELEGESVLLNLATGITDGPWFLFVAAAMGFPLLKSYSQLWQSGYSWRDVLSPPPAHDAISYATVAGRRNFLQPLPFACAPAF